MESCVAILPYSQNRCVDAYAFELLSVTRRCFNRNFHNLGSSHAYACDVVRMEDAEVMFGLRSNSLEVIDGYHTAMMDGWKRSISDGDVGIYSMFIPN